MTKLSYLLLISFLALAGFGLIFMANGYWHSLADCLATAVNGGLCPMQSPLDHVIYLLNSFKFFSSADFGSVGLLLMLVLTLALLLQIKPFVSIPSLLLSYSNKYNANSYFLPKDRLNLNYWSSLHENSPNK